MSTQPFGSRRVLESLRALGGYLDEAAESAARIPAGEVPKLTLERIPRHPGPRLSRVTWHSHNDAVVVGSGLKSVSAFSLVRGVDETFAMIDKNSVKDDGFRVYFKDDLAPGGYAARVVDDSGQEFVLRNVHVDEPHGGAHGPAPDAHGSVDPQPKGPNGGRSSGKSSAS